MREDPVDADTVLAQVERIGRLQTQLERHRVATMLAIRQELSPEERAALMELRQRMRRRYVGPILEACADEVETSCPGDGPRAIHRRLRRRDDLAGPCAQALDELPARFGRRRPGGRRAIPPSAGMGSRSPYEPPN